MKIQSGAAKKAEEHRNSLKQQRHNELVEKLDQIVGVLRAINVGLGVMTGVLIAAVVVFLLST